MKTKTDKQEKQVWRSGKAYPVAPDYQTPIEQAISSASVASDSPNQSNETRVGNWQSDPTHITTPRVQLWSQSGTMRGVISSELAVQLVNDGKHFVISCQAIGEI